MRIFLFNRARGGIRATVSPPKDARFGTQNSKVPRVLIFSPVLGILPLVLIPLYWGYYHQSLQYTPKDSRFQTLILTPALVLIFWYWGIIRNHMLRILGGFQEGSVYFTNKLTFVIIFRH